MIERGFASDQFIRSLPLGERGGYELMRQVADGLNGHTNGEQFAVLCFLLRELIMEMEDLKDRDVMVVAVLRYLTIRLE